MFGTAKVYPSRLQKQPGMNGVLLSFLLGIAGALAIFIPFLIVDKGFFLYCGDYNSQQIPFYYYVQYFLKTSGGGTWSWATDLGSSVVNSYSFYNLGSPFLWITLPFPQSWMPYLMVPLFALKFGAIAAGCCLYLSRYAKTRNMAVVCSLVYAFCGFNVYNIFFNHMLDAVVYFPLLLWAMDAFIYDRRRGVFAVVIGLALLNSYFFFIGNVVFALIYFIVKLALREYTPSVKDFGLLAFEAVLGVGLGMVLALPSFFNLIENPRTDNFATGFGMVMYGRVQQYFAIIASMFLPPDPPYLPNIFTDGVVKWTSMSFFLPIVGMGGVFAYVKAKKHSSIKTLLFIGLVMALVPFLNSSYYAFNASYYARWYYMPLLIAVFATLRSLEDEDIDLVKGVRLALILTGVFVIFGLLPNKTEDGGSAIGVMQETPKFWLTWLTAMLAMLIFYVLAQNYKGSARFGPLLLAAVMGFSTFYAVIHISLGKFEQWDRDSDFRQEQYVDARRLSLPGDEGFYRIDSYGMHDNVGLWADQSCLQTFNSVVTISIMEFYPMVGVKRDVSSKPETQHYALRGLLGVKYTVVPQDEVDAFITAPGTMGWNHHKTVGSLEVYENENYVPLGFTYDEYMPMNHLLSVREEDRAQLLMRGIGLTPEQQGRFAHLFEGQAVRWETITADDEAEYDGSGWYTYDVVDYAHYQEDCKDRKASASYYTSHDAKGFVSRIDLDRDNLVFFAVPYDPGFTATVNGEEAEVLRVSGGMMAVYAEAGDNEIVFSYRTPGLRQGAVVSIGCVLLLAGYLVFVGWYRRKKAAVGVPAAALPAGGVEAAPEEPDVLGAPDAIDECTEESGKETEEETDNETGKTTDEETGETP